MTFHFGKKFLMSCFIVRPIDWLPKFKPINMLNNLYVFPSIVIKQMRLSVDFEGMIHQVGVIIDVAVMRDSGGQWRMYENDK